MSSTFTFAESRVHIARSRAMCVTTLFAAKRIDRAMLGAEGRGALRRYGTCVTCSTERLLCGLAA